jgi:hypothetical protein
MDETRKPYAVRAMIYVAIAFVMFLAAEGLAHLSGRTDAAVATPAVAATTEPTDPLTGVGYLPRQFAVMEAAAEPIPTEPAPTF